LTLFELAAFAGSDLPRLTFFILAALALPRLIFAGLATLILLAHCRFSMCADRQRMAQPPVPDPLTHLSHALSAVRDALRAGDLSVTLVGGFSFPIFRDQRSSRERDASHSTIEK
jgi:hypothetical protein